MKYNIFEDIDFWCFMYFYKNYKCFFENGEEKVWGFKNEIIFFGFMNYMKIWIIFLVEILF